jgi:hypothetical protein
MEDVVLSQRVMGVGPAVGVGLEPDELDELSALRPGEIDRGLRAPAEIDDVLADGLLDARRPEAPEEGDLATAAGRPVSAGVERDDLAEGLGAATALAAMVLEVDPRTSPAR